MSRWIFLEDFTGLKHAVSMAINLDAIATVSPRDTESELVIFFSKAHIDPHVLAFKSKEACKSAYDDLKMLLKFENKKEDKQQRMTRK